MSVSRTRYGIALVSTLVGLVVGVSPVAAERHLGTTGTTGTHGLTDSRSSPAADCVYKFFDQGTQWELRRIIVRPPNAEAAASHGGDQQVGWRFSVERRRVNAFTGAGEWEHRYTSPTQTVTTDADHNASFSPMEVSVRVPNNSSADAWSDYRVIQKVFWYRDNGTVSGTARMRVEWFKSFFGNDRAKQRWSCRSNFFRPPG